MPSKAKWGLTALGLLLEHRPLMVSPAPDTVISFATCSAMPSTTFEEHWCDRLGQGRMPECVSVVVEKAELLVSLRIFGFLREE